MSKLLFIFPRGEVFDKAWISVKERLPEFSLERCCLGEGRELFTIADWHTFKHAERVIIDVTGNAASCLFLAGYAFALEKEVIVITQTSDFLAFDLLAGKLICYGGDFDFLSDGLKSRLGSRPTQGSAIHSGDDSATGKFNILFGDIVAKHLYTGKLEISMEGDKTFEIRDQEMELALVEELVKRARAKGLRLKLL
ncbi:MAG: hypothetical protein JWN25_2388 [Verrucomicrobiales bacterium]|nr:hypothetical protein [Verrucomicrobiales bacterium]MDB6128960.1 hypothetical protein [Verrucomicrobiales bacterium]